MALTNISICQNVRSYNQQADSIMLSNTKNHYYQDTLWVKDSILQYTMDLSAGLLLENTYKTISRDDKGNTISFLFLVNEDNPQASGYNIYDSTVYFNDESVKEHYANIWNNNEQRWILATYDEFESPSLKKETYYKRFSSTSQTFLYGNRKLYKNQDGLADSLIEQDYIPETDSWKKIRNTTFYYNDVNNDTLLMISSWKNNEWSDSAKVKQTFESNRLAQSIEFVLNDDSSSWQYFRKRIRTYTVSGKEEVYHQLHWDINTNYWIDDFKFITTYDSDDRISNKLYLEYDVTSQQLENYHNTLLIYGIESKEETHQLWNPSIGVWENYSQYYYSYIYENLIDTTLNNNWDNETQQWVGSYMDVSVFDEHYNLTNMMRENFTLNSWELQRKYDYYWSPFIPNTIAETNPDYSFKAYPNPASVSITFVLPDENMNYKDATTLSVFNLSGQKLVEILPANGELHWDCSNVEPGLYIYSMRVQGNKYSGKVIVK